VKAATRGSGASAQGTPRQAIAYLTEGHDELRDPELSGDELEYVAQMDPEGTAREAVTFIAKAADPPRGDPANAIAYVGRHESGRKADLEGGRVPLIGMGVLAGVSNDAKPERASPPGGLYSGLWAAPPWHQSLDTGLHSPCRHSVAWSPDVADIACAGPRRTGGG
jgi:hypothetical protein